VVSIGSYSPSVGQYQDDAEGNTASFTFNPYLSLTTKIPVLFPQFYAMPELGYVFNKVESSEEYKKRTIYVLYNFGYEFYPQFFFRFGIGTFITKIGGEGGAKEQNNGASTATFYLPGESVSSYNSTLNLGGEVSLLEGFATRADVYIFQLLESERREISFSIGLTYYPPGFGF
jgi:hypothetical protein